MRGLTIPIDVPDFQAGLRQRFSERDGMFFTPDQVVEYDEIKAKYGIEVQISIVFDIIYSESDAIQWLKSGCRKEPQTYQQIMADFRSANRATRKGETGIRAKASAD